MADHLISRLRRLHTGYFPRLRKQFRVFVDEGQHPTVLFIGCYDSCVVYYWLMDGAPGGLLIMHTVGVFVLPFDLSIEKARANDPFAGVDLLS